MDSESTLFAAISSLSQLMEKSVLRLPPFESCALPNERFLEMLHAATAADRRLYLAYYIESARVQLLRDLHTCTNFDAVDIEASHSAFCTMADIEKRIWHRIAFGENEAWWSGVTYTQRCRVSLSKYAKAITNRLGENWFCTKKTATWMQFEFTYSEHVKLLADYQRDQEREFSAMLDILLSKHEKLIRFPLDSLLFCESFSVVVPHDTAFEKYVQQATDNFVCIQKALERDMLPKIASFLEQD